MEDTKLMGGMKYLPLHQKCVFMRPNNKLQDQVLTQRDESYLPRNRLCIGSTTICSTRFQYGSLDSSVYHVANSLMKFFHTVGVLMFWYWVLYCHCWQSVHFRNATGDPSAIPEHWVAWPTIFDKCHWVGLSLSACVIQQTHGAKIGMWMGTESARCVHCGLITNHCNKHNRD